MSRIEVLHVSTAPSTSEFAALQKAVKPLGDDVGYGMPESSFKFHQLLRDGASQSDNVGVLSLVGRAIHPTVHRGLLWGTKVERVKPNLSIWHVSMLNVRGIKQIWAGIAFFVATLRWRRQTTGAKARILVIDAAYVTALPWILLALAGSNVRRLAIFADVYSYMGQVADARGEANKRQAAIRWVVRSMYARLNGFILLTQQMNDVVNPHKKPHMIMEGLVELESSNGDSQAIIKSHPPTILYAGALRKEYGLDVLLEGFSALRRPDVRLLVYGAGPYSAEIVSASKVDPRIVFGGRIPVTQVMQEQRKAWILVNTRRVEDEFTKYSFPSKILSYMSSGTAVLTTRLPGMPKDYFEHLFLINGTGAQGITDALDEMLSLSPRDLEMRGRQAQEFVLNKKNNVVQTARIIDFALGR